MTSTCMAEWENADVLALIELYEKQPVLWNMKHGGHNNKRLKQKAWEAIGDGLGGVHPAEAKRKMDSLLSSFRRERVRLKKLAEEGKDKGSRWYAYNSLLFLLDKYENIDNLEEDDNLRYKPQKSDDVTFIRLEAVHDSPDDPEDSSPKSSPRKSKRKGIKRHISIDSESHPTDFKSIDITTSHQDHQSNGNVDSQGRSTVTFQQQPPVVSTTPIFSTFAPLKDECGTYGEHVANKLRTYSKRTQAVVQYHINNVLFQADMSGFDHSTELAIDSTSAVLLSRNLNGESPAESEQQ